MRVRHSKGLALVGACILFAMSLAACGNSDTAADAANTASSAEVSSVAESTVAESTVAESSAAAPAETTTDLSGSISMVGSTSMEKLANALSEAFMEEHPDVTVTAEFVGSGAGIEAVTNGTTVPDVSAVPTPTRRNRILPRSLPYRTAKKRARSPKTLW